ncbi:MAG: transcriptional regulator [Rhodobacteraceae bacterium]|nr:transcriptional regulator [Paracoccaceae bacterium]MBR28552.1 transcriptional regulator [Paracoccaceae bacterium]
MAAAEDIGGSFERLTDDPLAIAADEIGDRWVLLIVCASQRGVSRFDDFHRELGVARNILSNRLRKLTELDILRRTPVREGARRMEYSLTDKGLALAEALMPVRDWSRAWCGDDELRARLRLPLRVRSDANGGDQGSDDVMPPRRPFDN